MSIVEDVFGHPIGMFANARSNLQGQLGNSVIVAAIPISLLDYFISSIVYNLFFHPLRSFPGPLLFRASPLMKMYHNFKGDMAFRVKSFHDQYGTVVRITPSELAFVEPAAWKGIYGHRPGGELPEWDGFYRLQGPSQTRNILSAGREEHSMLRRGLAHGFSERSMRAQEPIIKGYVDLLIRCLHERSEGGAEALNLKEWINWKTSQWDPWMKIIAENVQAVAIMQAVVGLGLSTLVDLAMRSGLIASQAGHQARTRQKMLDRMNLHTERPDLIEGLIRQQDELGVDRVQPNAEILIIAGSETTATLLSGALFALLTNPDSLQMLTNEVRSTFSDESEITLEFVQHLPYMLACLNETLRFYPPVMTGMPRITPKGGVIICGRHIPENTVVVVWQWAMNHDSSLWADPYEFHPERSTGGKQFERQP